MDAPLAVSGENVRVSPCFYWNWCLQRAAVEKIGRSVCRQCASGLRGYEYPLRDASVEPIYITGRAAADAMDMSEESSEPSGSKSHPE